LNYRIYLFHFAQLSCKRDSALADFSRFSLAQQRHSLFQIKSRNSSENKSSHCSGSRTNL